MKLTGILILCFLLSIFSSDHDWKEYNGDGNRSHYSPVSQINKNNVNQLQVAWSYASGGADTAQNRTQMQCNPIVIGGILYGVSADTQAFALDAATGQEKWKTSLTDNGGTTSRGLSYWTNGNEERIFFGAGKWIYALDAKTGRPAAGFGEQGRIDLRKGLERPGADHYVSANTPATIFNNLLITGVRVSENETALLGDIRAYSTETGTLVWTFKTIPERGDPAYRSWQPDEPRSRLGGANNWMGMAIDRKRGILYAPTGSAAHDFYGVNRKGNNLYANCLIALDANTGKKIWHYQLVHHDIWDRDPPAPPNLLTITRRGKKLDVVAQITKQGHTFVFERESGKPVFPIRETSFPQDGIPGEVPSPTQPIPELPEPFTRQAFLEKDFNPWVADRDSLLEMLREARTGTPYIPLSERTTIYFPGTDGGAQWGGAGADPEGILYIPAKEIPVHMTLKKRSEASDRQTSKPYALYCSSCHGADKKGSHDGSFPGLADIGKHRTRSEIMQVLATGKGMMPSFSHISKTERDAIVDFLLQEEPEKDVEITAKNVVPYQHLGYNRWYDRNGYPVSTPPWGTLTALNLNSGKKKWQVPLGEYPELTARGIAPTGTDNYGGPLVTGGGLVVIAASRDEKIRAFDKDTGKILWEAPLPAAGYASPSTYVVNNRQYIVIACGGGKLKTKSGDRYVAFALPERDFIRRP